MRILFFIPWLNKAGGAERVITTLANNLVNHGHVVHLQVFRDYKPYYYSIDNRVDVSSIRSKRNGSFIKRCLQTPVAIRNITTEFSVIVNDFRADIVVSFLFLSNNIAILSRKNIDVPVVISERNDPIVAGKAIHRWINALLYPKADMIICQGSNVANFYRSQSCNCLVLPNPLNSLAVGEYVNNKSNRIVSVGRLVPHKNHSMLIKAFSKIHPQYTDFVLEIVGEGEMLEELEKEICSLNLQSVVRIQENIKNVMTKVNDAACFVLPSDYEGMPNVLIEAMASGMPVVSTDFGTGIARELIADGVNGYVVPVGDVDKMAEAIEKIICSKDLQSKMGLENLKVRDRFNEEKICSQWEEALISIVNSMK